MGEPLDYATMAGFVLWRLGYIPRPGESFDWEGWHFVVKALKGRRIETVIANPIAEQEP